MKFKNSILIFFALLSGLFLKAQICTTQFVYTVDSLNMVQFTNTSNPLSSMNFTWEFESGVTDTAINPSYTYANPGIYLVKLDGIDTATLNTCSTSEYISVNACSTWVTSKHFSWNTSNNIYDFNVYNIGAPLKSNQWTFGDGSSTADNLFPRHAYDTIGTYTVTVTTTDILGNVCMDSTQVVVECVAGFDYTVDSLNTVSFSNQSQPIDSLDFLWFFDNSSASNPTDTVKDPTYTYPSSNVYYPYLQVTTPNGKRCYWRDTSSVNRCKTFLRSFRNNNTINFSSDYIGSLPVTYDWDFGNGDSLSVFTNDRYTDRNVSYTYDSSDTYQVVLRMTDPFNNVCADTTSFDLELCGAFFTKALDTVANAVVLSNHSSNSVGNTYQYDFGDGTVIDTSSRTISHNFPSFGTYYVCLTVKNSLQNCNVTYCDSVGLDSLGNLKSGGFSIRFVDSSFILVGEEQHALNPLTSINIYPNPSPGLFQISIDNLQKEEFLYLYSVTGALVKTIPVLSERFQMDLSSYKRGLYFIRYGNRVSKILLQ